VLLQGVLGYVQYFTGVPELLVAAHMLGSSLMWIAVVRLALSLRERAWAPTPAPTSPSLTPA
jgi:cytochrome c oxidase assembly protein subunit 15